MCSDTTCGQHASQSLSSQGIEKSDGRQIIVASGIGDPGASVWKERVWEIKQEFLWTKNQQVGQVKEKLGAQSNWVTLLWYYSENQKYYRHIMERCPYVSRALSLFQTKNDENSLECSGKVR